MAIFRSCSVRGSNVLMVSIPGCCCPELFWQSGHAGSGFSGAPVREVDGSTVAVDHLTSVGGQQRQPGVLHQVFIVADDVKVFPVVNRHVLAEGWDRVQNLQVHILGANVVVSKE